MRFFFYISVIYWWNILCRRFDSFSFPYRQRSGFWNATYLSVYICICSSVGSGIFLLFASAHPFLVASPVGLLPTCYYRDSESYATLLNVMSASFAAEFVNRCYLFWICKSFLIPARCLESVTVWSPKTEDEVSPKWDDLSLNPLWLSW
jgi:hypothetical protein